MKSNVLSLPFSEGLTPTSYELPKELSPDQWLEVGKALGKADRSLMWWIGDWWAYGEHRYGERTSVVQSEDWEGPAYQSCKNAAWVCRKFPTSTRVDGLSWRAHQQVAPLDNEDMRAEILGWAAKEQPTLKEIEAKVKEARSFLAQGWTSDQLERKRQAEQGLCVVASIREGKDGRRIDEALLAWAEANDKFTRIDRNTDWGNPFEIPADGDRDTVITKFERFYWPHKTGLLAKSKRLRGHVLGCWCHPEGCHGHIIAETVNQEAAGAGTAEEIAARMAEFEG